MARTAEVEEEQQVLFKELDDSPESKNLMKLARKLARIRAERSQLLGVSKEQEDEVMGKLVTAMNEAKMPAFKHDGIKVEIIKREKAKVTLDVDDDEEDGDDEGEE